MAGRGNTNLTFSACAMYVLWGAVDVQNSTCTVISLLEGSCIAYIYAYMHFWEVLGRIQEVQCLCTVAELFGCITEYY